MVFGAARAKHDRVLFRWLGRFVGVWEIDHLHMTVQASVLRGAAPGFMRKVSGRCDFHPDRNREPDRLRLRERVLRAGRGRMRMTICSGLAALRY
jgi:hypothetical protein